MGDIEILSVRDQSKLYSWLHFLGRGKGSTLGVKKWAKRLMEKKTHLGRRQEEQTAFPKAPGIPLGKGVAK